MTAPPPPALRFSVGMTGHRSRNKSYADSAQAIETELGKIFALIDSVVAATPMPFPGSKFAPTRLHTLLADGTDQVAAWLALECGWDIVSPLPFGRALNLAINALPVDLADAKLLLQGKMPADLATKARAESIEELAQRAQIFELADQDEKIEQLYRTMFGAPEDVGKAQNFAREAAVRATLAGRVLIEQSDLLIAVWDGQSTADPGGVGDTVVKALDHACPVVWINTAQPAQWRLLYAPESLTLQLGQVEEAERETGIAQIVAHTLSPIGNKGNPVAFLAERWHERSRRGAHGYRRIEALFDGGGRPFRSLVQRYETPEEIGTGSASTLLAEIGKLPGADPELAFAIESAALRNFAWADGISSRFSDAYRGGMIANFVLSAMAIVGGALYLPLTSVDHKWPFALFEFALLLAIMTITTMGQKQRWHSRWFETRRVAEYFRHSPLLLMLGVARAPGLWPQATAGSWPEWYARQTLRSIGLPRVQITPAYLSAMLEILLKWHVVPQRDYHAAKSKRLKRVHHGLDRLSEWLFGLAVISVAAFLMLQTAAALGWADAVAVRGMSKTFTLLGVLFPTFGAAIAGIRYFGDFERFAAISEVTAEKLDSINDRAKLLQCAPSGALCYRAVTELVHAADDVVISEIENWQSVFGGKNITVPV